MKKFLSLFLAVLMLASMAVSASAVKILKADGTFTDSVSIFESKHDDKHFSSIFDYCTYYKLPYGGAFNYGGETYYTWMYNNCPDCDGLSIQFVKNGDIKYECLEKNCGKTGTIVSSGSNVEIEYSGKNCTKCGSHKTVFVETITNSVGFVRDQYYCLNCKDIFYSSYDFDCILGTNYVKCSECPKATYFNKYYVDANILFAEYVCRDGHVTYKKVDNIHNNPVIYDKYRVYVYCTAGGSYSIENGGSAYYGETKTITFTPAYGYYLSSVLVDGYSVNVGVDNTVKVDVKNNTVVRAYFEKYSNLALHTIETSVEGNGTIAVKKNGCSVSADKVYANYADQITYTFIPATSNYRVADVEINGRSIGKVNTYNVSKILKDIDIKVTFEWKNPFTDVNKNYEDAVEFVTEAGIMGKGYITANKYYFNGGDKATVKTFVESLAELADIAGILNSTADRVEWAINKGLVAKDTDLSEVCDVQTACAIVREYLEVLEDVNDVRFTALDYEDSVKETAIAIDLVTEKIYDNNRDLTRYDVAAICYLIAGLDYLD